jgi:8-oxo-dGTP pyrophosphatase MutT (NUDIX family)
VTIVRGAGGVVWRRGSDGIEIVLVHRAARGEWSFPKGKLDHGEDERSAALREVLEETGLVPAIREDLGTVVYRDVKGRPKIVRYYAMRARGRDAPRPANEIDDARWCALARCAKVLTQDHDRRLLERFRPPAR